MSKVLADLVKPSTDLSSTLQKIPLHLSRCWIHLLFNPGVSDIWTAHSSFQWTWMHIEYYLFFNFVKRLQDTHTHTIFFPIGVQRNQSTSVRLRPTWIVVKRLKRKGHDTEWRFFRLITLHVKRTIVLEHPAVGTIGSTSKTLDYQAKGIQTMVDWIGANLGGMARRFKSENFFCLQAARVRVPGRSPFSQLKLRRTSCCCEIAQHSIQSISDNGLVAKKARKLRRRPVAPRNRHG